MKLTAGERRKECVCVSPRAPACVPTKRLQQTCSIIIWPQISVYRDDNHKAQLSPSFVTASKSNVTAVLSGTSRLLCSFHTMQMQDSNVYRNHVHDGPVHPLWTVLWVDWFKCACTMMQCGWWLTQHYSAALWQCWVFIRCRRSMRALRWKSTCACLHSEALRSVWGLKPSQRCWVTGRRACFSHHAHIRLSYMTQKRLHMLSLSVCGAGLRANAVELKHVVLEETGPIMFYAAWLHHLSSYEAQRLWLCSFFFFKPLRAVFHFLTLPPDKLAQCAHTHCSLPHLVCREVAPLACNSFNSSLMRCQVSVTVSGGRHVCLCVREIPLTLTTYVCVLTVYRNHYNHYYYCVNNARLSDCISFHFFCIFAKIFIFVYQWFESILKSCFLSLNNCFKIQITRDDSPATNRTCPAHRLLDYIAVVAVIPVNSDRTIFHMFFL